MQLTKISTLQQRYGLDSRQAVYSRLKALDIESPERGKITSEQLELMDKLDIHLKGGGTLANFPIQPEVQVLPLEKMEKRLDNELDKIDNELDNAGNLTAINLMAGLVEKMMGHIGNNRPPLDNYEALEKAIANNWILSTGQVRDLIGIVPRLHREETQLVWGSFIFTKAGKIGGQNGWTVTRTYRQLGEKHETI